MVLALIWLLHQLIDIAAPMSFQGSSNLANNFSVSWYSVNTAYNGNDLVVTIQIQSEFVIALQSGQEAQHVLCYQISLTGDTHDCFSGRFAVAGNQFKLAQRVYRVKNLAFPPNPVQFTADTTFSLSLLSSSDYERIF